ncbi:MAG: hypothetical protein ACPF8W_00115 [Luminiphilus sp.]
MSVLDTIVKTVIKSARKPGIEMADRILELRRQGRANEVTNEMMEEADQAYLTQNYPLPMDFDSRMQRAMDLGYDLDVFYRGTPKQMSAERPSDVWSSDNPYVGSTYSKYTDEGGAVLTPVVTRPGNAAVIDAKGNLYGLIPHSSVAEAGLVPPSGQPDAASRTFATNQLRDMALDYSPPRGYDSVEFQNIIDRGSQQLGTISDKGRLIPDVYAQQAANVPSRVRVGLPEDMRSIFGRFDPEMRHLRHLSSGVAGAGALPYIIQQYLDEAENEQRR